MGCKDMYPEGCLLPHQTKSLPFFLFFSFSSTPVLVCKSCSLHCDTDMNTAKPIPFCPTGCEGQLFYMGFIHMLYCITTMNRVTGNIHFHTILVYQLHTQALESEESPDTVFLLIILHLTVSFPVSPWT